MNKIVIQFFCLHTLQMSTTYNLVKISLIFVNKTAIAMRDLGGLKQ